MTTAYVSVALVGAFCLVSLARIVTGDAGIQSWLFLLTLPGVVGLVQGARVLRRRPQGTLLVVSGLATAAALVATAGAGFVAYGDSVFVAFAGGPLLLVPLPVVAAALAGSDR